MIDRTPIPIIGKTLRYYCKGFFYDRFEQYSDIYVEIMMRYSYFNHTGVPIQSQWLLNIYTIDAYSIILFCWGQS